MSDETDDADFDPQVLVDESFSYQMSKQSFAVLILLLQLVAAVNFFI